MKRPLCWAGFGFFAAAAAFCFLFPSAKALTVLLALLLPIGIVCLFLKKLRPAAIFCLSACAMAGYCIFYNFYVAEPALRLAGQTSLLQGTVVEAGNASFLLDGETQDGQKVRVQVWCRADMAPDRYWDFSGTVELAPIVSTDRFDSENYYRSQKVFLQGQLLSGDYETDAKPRIKDIPGKIQMYLSQKVRSILPGDYGGLVTAAVLGDRGYLSDGVKDLFEALGIQHLLAVSGIHLSLITGGLAWILSLFIRRQKMRTVILMGFTLLYIFLTGASASVARAGIMLFITYFGQLIQRQSDFATSLAAAVGVLLFSNPFLALNLGFLLSVCATFGVGIVSPALSARILSLKKQKPFSGTVSGFIKSLCVSFCGYVCTAPLLAVFDFKLTPMSIPANILLSPLFSCVLASGALLTFLCFVPAVREVLAFFSRVFIFLLLSCAGILKKIGPAPIPLRGVASAVTIIVFSVAFIYIACRATRRQAAIALCLSAVIGCFSFCAQSVADAGSVYAYTAVFQKRILQIFTCSGHAIVIGHLTSSSQIDQAALQLQQEKVDTIDLLVLLPYGGSPRGSLSPITDEFEVKLLLSPSPEDLSTQSLESLQGVERYESLPFAASFWQNGRLIVDEDGSVRVAVGQKKMLILPDDCDILEKTDVDWDLVVTTRNTPPSLKAGAMLCSQPFWGTEDNNPHAYLLPYGKGVKYRVGLY